MPLVSANRVREKAVTFGPKRELVGVLTSPADGPDPRAPHVVLLNSGIIHRVGTNRISVSVARALAVDRVSALRFDLSGIGDSERRPAGGSLSEAVGRDIADALEFLTRTCGAERFILMGICSGAYDAFHGALADSRVTGAFMVDFPGPFQGVSHTLHHLRARLFRPASWRNPFHKLRYHLRTTVAAELGRGEEDGFISGARPTPPRQQMAEQMEQLLARGVALRFVFTGGLEENYNHRNQFRTVFPTAARHPRLTYEFFPAADHTLSKSAERERVVMDACEWTLARGGQAT